MFTYFYYVECTDTKNRLIKRSGIISVGSPVRTEERLNRIRKEIGFILFKEHGCIFDLIIKQFNII